MGVDYAKESEGFGLTVGKLVDLVGANIKDVSERKLHSLFADQSVPLTSHDYYHMFVLVLFEGGISALRDLEIADVETRRLSRFTGEDTAGNTIPAVVLRFVLFGGNMAPVEAAQVAKQLGDIG